MQAALRANEALVLQNRAAEEKKTDLKIRWQESCARETALTLQIAASETTVTQARADALELEQHVRVCMVLVFFYFVIIVIYLCVFVGISPSVAHPC